MEKFKYSVPGWMFFIDGSGKTEFPIGKKYVEDLKKYLAAGNEIEPEFTDEELAEKEARGAEQALESQNNQLIKLLNDSDKKVNGSYPNTDKEKAVWESRRAEWRAILKSGIIQEIPPAPF